MQAAARGRSAPAWRDLLPHRRAALLHRIGERSTRDAEPFARLQMLENGKVLAECVAQAKSAAATFRYYAAVCETLGSEAHAGARRLPVDDACTSPMAWSRRSRRGTRR